MVTPSSASPKNVKRQQQKQKEDSASYTINSIDDPSQKHIAQALHRSRQPHKGTKDANYRSSPPSLAELDRKVAITIQSSRADFDEKAEVLVQLNNPDAVVEKMLRTLANRFPPESVLTIQAKNGYSDSVADKSYEDDPSAASAEGSVDRDTSGGITDSAGGPSGMAGRRRHPVDSDVERERARERDRERDQHYGKGGPSPKGKSDIGLTPSRTQSSSGGKHGRYKTPSGGRYPKSADGKHGDPRYGDGKYGDGKPGDGKPGDGKYGDPRYGDGKYGDGRPGDGKYGDPRYGDGKYGDPRYGDDRSSTADKHRKTPYDDGRPIGAGDKYGRPLQPGGRKSGDRLGDYDSVGKGRRRRKTLSSRSDSYGDGDKHGRYGRPTLTPEKEAKMLGKKKSGGGSLSEDAAKRMGLSPTSQYSRVLSDVAGTSRVLSDVLGTSEYVDESGQTMPYRIVEVPVVEEVIREVTRREIIEVEKRVPKYEYEWQERVVEVPEVKYVDKIVEVPEVREVVKHVPKYEVQMVPREYIQYVPKVVDKIVERVVEVPQVIEVPRPYRVERQVSVPGTFVKEVETIVAQVVKPVLIDDDDYREDVPLKTYEPKIVTVDVFIPVPIPSRMKNLGKTGEEFNQVPIPAAHYNTLTQALNPMLGPPDKVRGPPYRADSHGNYPVLPPSEKVDIITPSGELHDTTPAPSRFPPQFPRPMEPLTPDGRMDTFGARSVGATGGGGFGQTGIPQMGGRLGDGTTDGSRSGAATIGGPVSARYPPDYDVGSKYDKLMATSPTPLMHGRFDSKSAAPSGPSAAPGAYDSRTGRGYDDARKYGSQGTSSLSRGYGGKHAAERRYESSAAKISAAYDESERPTRRGMTEGSKDAAALGSATRRPFDSDAASPFAKHFAPFDRLRRASDADSYAGGGVPTYDMKHKKDKQQRERTSTKDSKAYGRKDRDDSSAERPGGRKHRGAGGHVKPKVSDGIVERSRTDYRRFLDEPKSGRMRSYEKKGGRKHHQPREPSSGAVKRSYSADAPRAKRPGRHGSPARGTRRDRYETRYGSPDMTTTEEATTTTEDKHATKRHPRGVDGGKKKQAPRKVASEETTTSSGTSSSSKDSAEAGTASMVSTDDTSKEEPPRKRAKRKVGGGSKYVDPTMLMGHGYMPGVVPYGSMPGQTKGGKVGPSAHMMPLMPMMPMSAGGKYGGAGGPFMVQPQPQSSRKTAVKDLRKQREMRVKSAADGIYASGEMTYDPNMCTIHVPVPLELKQGARLPCRPPPIVATMPC